MYMHHLICNNVLQFQELVLLVIVNFHVRDAYPKGKLTYWTRGHNTHIYPCSTLTNL